MTEITQGDYQIYMCDNNVFLSHSNYSNVVSIEKFDCNLSESNKDVLKKHNIIGIIKPHAILGIIKVMKHNFLLYVKSAILIGTLEEADIFKVKEADLIPIADDFIVNNMSSEVKSLIIGLKNLLTLGFFYSFNYDLTNSRQKQMKNKNSNIFESTERKFFWNYSLYNKFNEGSINKAFYVVMICGYVGIYKDNVFDNSIVLCLISRRSVFHAGTRYNTRGINDDGNVANYVETEQILKFSNHLLSLVQIRGSAPVFFQQIGVTAHTVITRSPEMSSSPFTKHIEELQKDFAMSYLINLMNSHKPGEQIITQNVENLIKVNKPNKLRYYFFDFQSECKYDNYNNLDSFVSTIEKVLNIFKFYCENTNTGEIHKEQLGVVRTNCLDCLDRTNVIQTRIGWKILELQLNFLNINTSSVFSVNFQSNLNNSKLMQVFKEMWADNGDFISIQYAGTASTITSVTRHGKHGIFGLVQHGIVSLTRFYQGSFEDEAKQRCFDLLLQKAVSTCCI